MKTTPTKTLSLHRSTRLVPEMRPDEYAQLRDDIRAHDIRVPLDVLGTTVLDGRHRLRAAKELELAQVPIREVVLDGDSETAWVLKAAVLRRHLSDDQRAMMAALYAKQHARKEGRPAKNCGPRGPQLKNPARVEAAQSMNVAPNRVKKAATVLKDAPALAAQVHAGELKLAQAVRRVRQTAARKTAKQLPRIKGLYEVIVMDPPWTYDRQPADSGMRGEVDYATESVDSLAKRTLPAANNCILWLWTTNAFMREAYDLLTAWGFTPKTILTWDKAHMGLGEWLRNVTEHCILAVRGRPVVTLTKQTTLIREARRQHSRKPDAFYALVDSLCPGRKLDFFGRTARKGWDTYGLEADKFAASL